jgi:hypothetical protein
VRAHARRRGRALAAALAAAIGGCGRASEPEARDPPSRAHASPWGGSPRAFDRLHREAGDPYGLGVRATAGERDAAPDGR